MKQLQAPILESETADFVQLVAAAVDKPINEFPIEEARELLIGAQSQPKEMKEASIEQRTIKAGPSGSISLTLVRPPNAVGKLPAIMFFHGGGWILGNFTTHERLVRELASQANSLVVFVNFTPSPEAKYPTPIEEAYAATKYVSEHKQEFQIEENKLAVCGDSVGGNMAIAVTLLSKERGGPTIQKQILFYPVTDANFSTESYNQFAHGPWLTKSAMQWFWDAYCPDLSVRKEITVSPLNAPIKSLRGLPPALIVTAENDVLRDEGEAYARKLIEAGVPVTATRYLGTIHDFVMLDGLANTPAAQAAMKVAVAFTKAE